MYEMTDPITERKMREACRKQREEQMLDITNAVRRGDLKFLYEQHCKKQAMFGREPVCYKAFLERLKVMTVRDAIYKERENNRSHKGGRKMNRGLTNAELQARKADMKNEIKVIKKQNIIEKQPPEIEIENPWIKVLNRFKNLFN